VLRGVFALCAGLFAAMIVYTISAATAMRLWPPTGVDLKDAAQVAAFVAALPVTARATLVCGPVLGAFVGAGVGSRLASPASQAPVAAFIGALVAANTAFDWSRVGHPFWMLATGVALVLLATLLATLLVRKAWPAPGR
jgi:hypothetical protein